MKIYQFVLFILLFNGSLLGQTGTFEIESLDGSKESPILVDKEGQLIRNYEYTLEISGSDFVAYNSDGSHEKYTMYNHVYGRFGDEGDKHYLEASVNFPFDCTLTKITAYGTDLVADKSLYMQMLKYPFESSLVPYGTPSRQAEDIHIHETTEEIDNALLFEVYLDYPIDTKNWQHVLFISPWKTEGECCSEEWEDKKLAIRSIVFNYQVK